MLPGGVFNNDGIVTISHSTVSDNSAGTNGGGVYNDNGIIAISDNPV
jgi:predicted outer membrane repeat protein